MLAPVPENSHYQKCARTSVAHHGGKLEVMQVSLCVVGRKHWAGYSGKVRSTDDVHAHRVLGTKVVNRMCIMSCTKIKNIAQK